MKYLISPLLALFLCVGSAQAQEEFIRLNASKKVLNVERGAVELSGVKGSLPSTMWEKVSAGGGLFFFRNRKTGQYLVASGTTVTTTDKQPSRQGAGPHYWRYTQPFPKQPLVSALTTQSGLYLNETSTGLALEKTSSPTTLQIEEVRPKSEQPAPVTVEYQRLLNTKKSPLHIEKGPPMFSSTDIASPGCMWEVKEMSNVSGRGQFFTFTNRKTGQALSSSGTSLTTEALGAINTGKEPFLWRATRNGDVLELKNSQGATLRDILLQPVK